MVTFVGDFHSRHIGLSHVGAVAGLDLLRATHHLLRCAQDIVPGIARTLRHIFDGYLVS